MITIKAQFRHLFGYDTSHKCKECAHCVGVRANRTHYKCEKMGITHSAATDIRLKDDSCRLFEMDGGEI